MWKKLVTLAFCGLFAVSAAHAGNLELKIGGVQQDMEDPDATAGTIETDGTAYGVGLDQAIGDSGWLTGHIAANRVGAFSETEMGAYLLDVDLLVNLARNNPRFDFDVGGGIGGLFGDVITDEMTVSITDGEETFTTETEVTEQETFLTANFTARTMIWFSSGQKFGLGAEYRLHMPLDEDRMIDKTASTTVYLSLPLQ